MPGSITVKDIPRTLFYLYFPFILFGFIGVLGLYSRDRTLAFATFIFALIVPTIGYSVAI